jgi:hypothetical protein
MWWFFGINSIARSITLVALVEKGATIPVPEALLYRKSNRY